MPSWTTATGRITSIAWLPNRSIVRFKGGETDERERERIELRALGPYLEWSLMETILDFEKGIRYDAERPRLLHAHTIDAHRHGLRHLARQVRETEQQYIDASIWPSDGGELIEDFGHFEPVTYCAFNWFAITLTSYFRLIALIDLLNRNDWSILDLVANERIIAKSCSEYVEDIAPAVTKWRNKVAAHPAATSPIAAGDKRGADRVGTLLQSFSYPVSRTAGYFEVARVKWKFDDGLSSLRPWSVTATYERLTPRFWPESPIPPHRHRPGSEPLDAPGTYLRLARQAV